MLKSVRLWSLISAILVAVALSCTAQTQEAQPAAAPLPAAPAPAASQAPAGVPQAPQQPAAPLPAAPAAAALSAPTSPVHTAWRHTHKGCASPCTGHGRRTLWNPCGLRAEPLLPRYSA